ncbi:MAG: ABC transporter substrate-binding protein [Thermoproteota archaeon]
MEGKTSFKRLSVFLMIVLLASIGAVAPVHAGLPNMEEIYFTIAYPEATTMSYARAGYLDTVLGMIDPSNVRELSAGAEGIVLKPNGPGTYTQWTPVGDSPNWKCVDEGIVPDGDTTYVKSMTDGSVDSYALEDTTKIGTIRSVTVLFYAKFINMSETTNRADQVQVLLKVGDVEGYSSPFTLTKGYPYIGSPLRFSNSTRPDGKEWTWDDINALEVGFKHVVRDAADEVRITSVFVEVDYLPPGVPPPWSISMNPGFHMCYLGINCRQHPPLLGPGEPKITGAPYDWENRGPDFELWPLNESDFRLALHYLIGCKKDEWIATLYEFINVRLDTCVPPANLFYYNRDIPPMKYDPAEAMSLLNSLGWSNATGKWIHTPSGRELRPIYVMSPVEAPPSVALTNFCVEEWNKFFGTTDSTWMGKKYHEGTADEGKYFHNYPISFYTLADLAFCNRDHDIYFLCWGLGRDPDSLYYFFHPDLDYYDGYNSPGLRTPNNELEDMLYALEYWVFPEGTQAEVAINPEHPAYVGMTVDNVNEMKKLCDEIQWWLYYLVPYIPLYSRNYINAFRYGLKGWIESRGYGSHNGWTYLFLRWDEAIYPGRTTYNMHVSGPLNTLHPGWWTSAYEGQVLGVILDGFLTVDPFTHSDVNWAIKSYTYELFKGTTPGGNYCDGSKAVFKIRSGIYWHDGEPFTAEDAKFSWEIIYRFKPRQGSTIWMTFVEANIIDDYTVEVYYNGTGIWLLYDYAGTAMMFPPQIYSKFTDAASFKAFKPWEVKYKDWTGKDPLFSYTFSLTCLIGTGPYVFHEWDVVAGKVHVVAFNNYFAKDFLREDINIDGKVDMKDIIIAIGAFGSTPADPRWMYGRADVNWDYKCDMKDIIMTIGKFGSITLP